MALSRRTLALVLFLLLPMFLWIINISLSSSIYDHQKYKVQSFRYVMKETEDNEESDATDERIDAELMNSIYLGNDKSKAQYIFDLTYVINEKDFCKKYPDMYIITYVHTAANKQGNRQLIRDTWGSIRYYNATKLRVIFVFGKPQSASEQRRIRSESRRHQDIIQLDFVDSYKNLSYKGVAALKWISEYCPGPKWVLKSDDDMIINTIALSDYLPKFLEFYNKQVKHKNNFHGSSAMDKILYLEDTSIPENNMKKDFEKIMCAVWFQMPTLRGKGCSKWCVSEEEWPFPSYPTYCSGSAFVFPRKITPRLYQAYYKSRFLWVDDAYVSGVLPAISGISHYPFHSMYELNHNLIEKNMIYGNRLFCHHPGEHDVRAKWWPFITKKEGLS